MAIGRIDLNLIKVFNAVYEDKNLLRAGKRLNLSASAVSHALTRLRQVVGDDLFVRTPNGMTPTARADAMARDLTDSLSRIAAALGLDPFSPTESTRQFVLAANDHLAAVVIPHLTRLMAAEAPGVRLVVRPATRLDLAEQVDVGRIDLAMGVFQRIPDHFRSFSLMTEGDLVIMHRSHPAAGRSLTLQDMANFPLLTVSVGGKEEGAVDGFILERGLARQSEMFDRNALQEALDVIGAVPKYHITSAHSSVVALVITGTEMLSILPCSLARLFAATGDFRMVLPPYPVSQSTFRGIWHNRNDHDPAHLWLRRMVQRAAELMPKGIPE